MRLIAAIITFLWATAAYAADPTQVLWGNQAGSPNSIVFKSGSSWIPIGTYNGTTFSLPAGSALSNLGGVGVALDTILGLSGATPVGILNRTGAGAWAESSLSSLIDSAFSSTQGSILYRGASSWAALGPGTAGQVLQTGGASANPSFATFSVANNSALTALATTAVPNGTHVFRQGFTSPGDGGEMVYQAAASACSLNSGNGDNGSQVKSADSKCWLWEPHGYKVTPMVFGATGNGTADDTTMVKSAMTAMYGGTLYTGNFIYGLSSGLAPTSRITIKGERGGPGGYTTSCLNGFRMLAANFDVITLGASGSKIEETCFDKAAGVTNTSGYGVLVSALSNIDVVSNAFYGICNAVSVTGSGWTQALSNRILKNSIYPASGANCWGITIGASSVGAATVDTVITDNSIGCNGSGNGIVFYDSGGAFVSHNTPYQCGVGTKIYPGASQDVIWSYFHDTVLGDTSGTNDLLIDTGSSSAVIFGQQFDGTWASSASGGHNVLIQNTASAGSYEGIRFVAHRTYMGTTSYDGFHIVNVKDFQIRNSTICSGAANTQSAINIASSVTTWSVQNNRIGVCDNFGGSLATGITAAAADTDMSITNNDFTGSTTPVSLSGIVAGTHFIMGGNVGIDENHPLIASASTISAPLNPTFFISGSTSITTINGWWHGRQVTMIPEADVAFAGGGNICGTVSATANTPVIGTYDSGFGCWFLK